MLGGLPVDVQFSYRKLVSEVQFARIGGRRMQGIEHAAQPIEAWRQGVETRMHVSSRNGATQLCIFEQWVAPMLGAPTHAHSVEEVLTVISGEAEIWIEDARTVLTSGQSIIVPPHRKHGFRNTGSDALHIHAVLAAPFFEASYDGSSQPMRRWAPMDEGS
jgi:mannose-6-phosphate isomerase-like protein (cupin superfamily)